MKVSVVAYIRIIFEKTKTLEDQSKKEILIEINARLRDFEQSNGKKKAKK